MASVGGAPPTLSSVYPLFFVRLLQFFRTAPTAAGWHPPPADKGGYPHPLRSGDPSDPHHGVLSTITPSPHLRHTRGYPLPVPVFNFRRRPHPGTHRFACKTRGYPPFGAMRCPPTRSKWGTPSDPPKGSGSHRPPPPSQGVRVGVPPLKVRGEGPR